MALRFCGAGGRSWSVLGRFEMALAAGVGDVVDVSVGEDDSFNLHSQFLDPIQNAIDLVTGIDQKSAFGCFRVDDHGVHGEGSDGWR